MWLYFSLCQRKKDVKKMWYVIPVDMTWKTEGTLTSTSDISK